MTTQQWPDKEIPAPGADLATDSLKALDAIKERIELTYRICCGLAPKQAVGELLAATRAMLEWDAIRAVLAAVPASEPVASLVCCENYSHNGAHQICCGEPIAAPAPVSGMPDLASCPSDCMGQCPLCCDWYARANPAKEQK